MDRRSHFGARIIGCPILSREEKLEPMTDKRQDYAAIFELPQRRNRPARISLFGRHATARPDRAGIPVWARPALAAASNPQVRLRRAGGIARGSPAIGAVFEIERAEKTPDRLARYRRSRLSHFSPLYFGFVSRNPGGICRRESANKPIPSPPVELQCASRGESSKATLAFNQALRIASSPPPASRARPEDRTACLETHAGR